MWRSNTAQKHRRVFDSRFRLPPGAAAAVRVLIFLSRASTRSFALTSASVANILSIIESIQQYADQSMYPSTHALSYNNTMSSCWNAPVAAPAHASAGQQPVHWMLQREQLASQDQSLVSAYKR